MRTALKLTIKAAYLIVQEQSMVGVVMEILLLMFVNLFVGTQKLLILKFVTMELMMAKDVV